jgi:hypothetical protein
LDVGLAVFVCYSLECFDPPVGVWEAKICWPSVMPRWVSAEVDKAIKTIAIFSLVDGTNRSGALVDGAGSVDDLTFFSKHGDLREIDWVNSERRCFWLNLESEDEGKNTEQEYVSCHMEVRNKNNIKELFWAQLLNPVRCSM